MNLYSEIQAIIKSIDTNTIDAKRKIVLQPLIDFIQLKVNEQQAIRLNFICTHNSRRSHLGQIWARTMAFHFNIQNVQTFSGGTESTALFPVVAQTLKEMGFDVQFLSKGENPIYGIKYAPNEQAIIGFSKKWDDGFNPSNEFAAIMTCTEADGACPIIAGAEKRVPITYEDPKAFDNTPQQAEMYRERSLQIATELFYVFSQINS